MALTEKVPELNVGSSVFVAFPPPSSVPMPVLFIRKIVGVFMSIFCVSLCAMEAPLFALVSVGTF